MISLRVHSILRSRECRRTGNDAIASSAHRSFATHLISWCCSLQPSWQVLATSRVVSRLSIVALWEELPDVLHGGWASQERLGQRLWDLAAVIEELVVQDLIQVRASFGITSQNPLDQIASRIRNVDVIGERVMILPDSSIRGLDVGRLKGRLTNYQSVDDDA